MTLIPVPTKTARCHSDIPKWPPRHAQTSILSSCCSVASLLLHLVFSTLSLAGLLSVGLLSSSLSLLLPPCSVAPPRKRLRRKITLEQPRLQRWEDCLRCGLQLRGEPSLLA